MIVHTVPAAPPYALHSPRFRFRALAALAGRAPLGGDREVALAALLAARLVVATLPPQPLPQGVRSMRASGAKSWLAALTLPAALRVSLVRLIDATTSVDRGVLATALGNAIDACASHLDAHALGELRDVARDVAAVT